MQTTLFRAAALVLGAGMASADLIYMAEEHRGFMGCFEASEQMTQNKVAGTGSLSYCMQACHVQGFGYAAVRGKGECFCGKATGDLQRAEPATCNCKANWKDGMSTGGHCVYDLKEALPGPSFVGCYKDAAERDLPAFMGNLNSVGLCRDRCRAEGYTFAGVQGKGECWCGSSPLRYGLAADECDCIPGDPVELEDHISGNVKDYGLGHNCVFLRGTKAMRYSRECPADLQWNYVEYFSAVADRQSCYNRFCVDLPRQDGMCSFVHYDSVKRTCAVFVESLFSQAGENDKQGCEDLSGPFWVQDQNEVFLFKGEHREEGPQMIQGPAFTEPASSASDLTRIYAAAGGAAAIAAVVVAGVVLRRRTQKSPAAQQPQLDVEDKLGVSVSTSNPLADAA